MYIYIYVRILNIIVYDLSAYVAASLPDLYRSNEAINN
jgi:hypothetical protein